ncbi:hypothetical protein [Amylibacter marinus]|uniref:hypothetical protein n=1 Tax=Amylibacter marinus TaxID=1475483 RepID=UPI0024E195AA|nr:hypothetical protein [Amylibacter marinus]
MKPYIKHIRRHLVSFRDDTNGGALDTVLIVGVISLPLVLFLAIFGQNVIEWVQDNAPNIFDEAASWIG